MSKRGRKKNNVTEIRTNFYNYVIKICNSNLSNSINVINKSLIRRNVDRREELKNDILFDEDQFKLAIIDY